MKNYELLKTIVSLLEGGCFVLSLFCAYCYYKNVIIKKSPINESFLIFDNIIDISIILSMLIFSILNVILIFLTSSIYFFKIVFLFFCIVFIVLLILKSDKVKNGKRK